MKKVLLGFVIGFMVASSAVFATNTDIFIAERATFDVVVDGVLFEGEKPVVAIDGNTYLSLTDTGKALDIPVGWNAEKRRVEVGTMPTMEPTPTPTITPESPENIGQIYEDDKIKIEVLDFRFPKYEEFGLISNTNRILSVKIRVTNKTDVFIPLEFEDFKGTYRLKTPPTITNQFQYVDSAIYSNKGNNTFVTGIYDPKLSVKENHKKLINFYFHMLAPNEVREGNIVFQTVKFNYEFLGIQYKDNKIIVKP